MPIPRPAAGAGKLAAVEVAGDEQTMMLETWAKWEKLPSLASSARTLLSTARTVYAMPWCST